MSRAKRSAVYRNVQRTLLAVQARSYAVRMAPSEDERLAQGQELIQANRQLQLACAQAAENYRKDSGAQLFARIAAMALGVIVDTSQAAIDPAQAPAITTLSGGA